MGVYIQGNYAYVADEQNGLVIIDVSSFLQLPAGKVDVGPARKIKTNGNYAYIVNSGLSIFDISNPNTIRISSDIYMVMHKMYSFPTNLHT